MGYWKRRDNVLQYLKPAYEILEGNTECGLKVQVLVVAVS